MAITRSFSNISGWRFCACVQIPSITSIFPGIYNLALYYDKQNDWFSSASSQQHAKVPAQDCLLARQRGWAPYSISIEDGITRLLVKYWRRKEKTTTQVLKFDASPYIKEQKYSAPSFSHSNSEVEKGTGSSPALEMAQEAPKAQGRRTKTVWIMAENVIE